MDLACDQETENENNSEKNDIRNKGIVIISYHRYYK